MKIIMASPDFHFKIIHMRQDNIVKESDGRLGKNARVSKSYSKAADFVAAIPFHEFLLTVHESDHTRFWDEADQLGQPEDSKKDLEDSANKHGHVQNVQPFRIRQIS